MATKSFKYYLRDDYQSGERAAWIEKQIGEKLSESARENLGQPFYEVGLECTVDTETGEVKIAGVLS